MKQIVACLLALLVFTSTPALAVDYPPAPNGPILDEANLLSPEREAALDARLRAVNAKTGRSLVIVTVNSLQGETIEMYSVKLFEAWGIGGKETDEGLLLLVAPNERKVRIEVGYGLHGYVTDGLSGRIIRTIISPRFKNGDMAGGIEAGTNALLEQLSRTPADAKAVAEAADAAQRQGRQANGGGTIATAIIIVIVMLLIIMSFARRSTMRGSRRYHGRDDAGISPVVIWAASEIIGSALRDNHRGGSSWGGGGWGGGDGGGFGGFGGGGSGGGGASGDW